MKGGGITGGIVQHAPFCLRSSSAPEADQNVGLIPKLIDALIVVVKKLAADLGMCAQGRRVYYLLFSASLSDASDVPERTGYHANGADRFRQ